MKQHRFWLQKFPLPGNLSITDPALTHQIKNVLKLQRNEKIKVFNDSGEWQAEISALLPNSIELTNLLAIAPQPQPTIALHMAMSVLKGDTWDDSIRQCTEIGITDFQPLICDRSIVRTITPHKLTRWKRIAQEATEQSGWPHIPDFFPVQELKKWILLQDKIPLWVADMGGTPLASLKIPAELRLLIGPEGGWSEEEIDLFSNHHIQIIRFGPSTLTARVAPVALGAAILGR